VKIARNQRGQSLPIPGPARGFCGLAKTLLASVGSVDRTVGYLSLHTGTKRQLLRLRVRCPVIVRYTELINLS
jgi:hypothetical protein